MANAVKIYKHKDVPAEPGTYHRLVCLTGENKGRAYFIIGKRIVMGRSEKCDVTILDLKSSREHAEITLAGGNYILTDLGSQNGVMVNDLKVKQHVLANGDKIIIGKTVYKFSKMVVKADEKEKVQETKPAKSVDAPAEEKKNKRMTIILGGLLVLGLLLLVDEEAEITQDENKPVRTKVKEIDDSFQRAIEKRNKRNQKNKEKLAIYFKRGLREYREGNYFRAINEFESARQWSPNDSLANFYLRKTREKLDEHIQSYFSKATRDMDAINYMKASTSYCAVIRLLDKYPNDPRYKTAEEGIRNLEKKLGMSEVEIICIDKKGSE